MVGCQYKTSQLEIPAETNKKFGTFSASVWINPSDGRSKVMFQGQAYMTFLTFIVPDILEEIRPDKTASKSVKDKVSSDIPAVDNGLVEAIVVKAIETEVVKASETEVVNASETDVVKAG